MMISRAAITACVLLLGWQSTAQSEAIYRFKVANWKGGAYASNKTGNFSHCAASVKYRSGISVAFLVNRRYRWSMKFGNPDWRLTPREVYPIAFSIDGVDPISAKALATTTKIIEVPLADSARLFERFKRGNLLKVAAAKQVFSFRLTDTSRILPRLLRCVREELEETRFARRSSNPFAATGGAGNPFAKPSATADNAATRAEATMIAANLMSLSGIKGFRILSRDEASSIKADAVWRAGNALGTVRILSPKVTDDVKNLSGLLIGADARKCKGRFASGALPAESNNAMVRVFTSCKTGEKTFTVYYLALTRNKGGYYLFATASSGSEQPAKEADANIRQAVLQAIPK